MSMWSFRKKKTKWVAGAGKGRPGEFMKSGPVPAAGLHKLFQIGDTAGRFPMFSFYPGQGF
jgi:hypothetical protein